MAPAPHIFQQEVGNDGGAEGVSLARALSNGVLLAVIETPTLFAKSANKGWGTRTNSELSFAQFGSRLA